jgi:hypothetical protein
MLFYSIKKRTINRPCVLLSGIARAEDPAGKRSLLSEEVEETCGKRNMLT